VCPRDLLPDQLFKLAQGHSWEAAADLGLQACIECGLCDRACPSDINLAAIFTQAKRIDTYRRQDKEHKANIKQRYDAHAARLQEREDAALQRRAERLQKRRSQDIGSNDKKVGS
ncbi:MAG: 4Fe-4S dicluster domain-containing protein, partial [Pseudomonadota bacterium]|nr:4Fe-4S dicluster domain-containing protein [Pseudomonadota bacterium]